MAHSIEYHSYEFMSAGMAAFIIKWVMENDVTEEKAVALPAEILLRISVKLPKQLSQQFEPVK